jgi:hypothetical protein
MTNKFFVGHNVDVDNFSKAMVCFWCDNHTDALKFMDDPTCFPNDMFLVHPAAVTNAFNVGDFTFIHADCSFFSKVDVDDVDDSCDCDDTDINSNKFANWFFSDSDDFNDFCDSVFFCS